MNVEGKFLQYALSLIIIIILLKAQVSCYHLAKVFDSCHFFENESVSYVCQGRIHRGFYLKWQSSCPPTGSIYSLWTNNAHRTHFAAFHEIKLSKFNSITIGNSGHIIHGYSSNNKHEDLSLPKATMLCFISKIPYIDNLYEKCANLRAATVEANNTIIYFSTGNMYASCTTLPRSMNVLLLVVIVLLLSKMLTCF